MRASSAAEALASTDSTVMPAPTSAGVLGMALMHTTPAPRPRCKSARVIPAASETTMVPGLTSPEIKASNGATSSGLTTMRMTSASAAAAAGSRTGTRYFALISAARAACFSLMTISLAAVPLASSPAINVSPITPAPKMAITGRRLRLLLDQSRVEYEDL